MSEELQAQREARSNQLEAQNSQLESRNSHLEAQNSQLESRNSHLEAQNSQLESRNSQLEAQNSQLQDSLTEYVESASSMSQATKKQKIVTWADILCPLQIAMPKKIDCILSPNNFHKLPLENKKLTLEVIGLEDQFDAINDEVARSLGMSTLPSPSNMQVSDILAGSLSTNKLDRDRLEKVTSKENIQELMVKVNEIFLNTTEMEATIRVAMCILEAAWDLPNLRVKLQPSLFSHSVFTDVLFFFYGHENQLNGFIEIKKSDSYTNLSLHVKATAQTLREAHILLMEKGMDTVVFGLTNSIVWSFAKATKYGVQIKVDQFVNLDVERDHEKIFKMLEYVMQGKWPQY